MLSGWSEVSLLARWSCKCDDSVAVVRRGNNGGSWDPSSQKIFDLTENFYFIAEMELTQRNKPSFFLNLVIIGVSNTTLSQKILG